MDWTRAIDGYCERTDPSYWSEPINALTNLAFLVAAAIMWRRSPGRTPARVLSSVLALIGIGSWLFHTHATAWAALADTTPIMGFTLIYIYLANRDFLGLPPWLSGLGALAYIPYTAALTPVFDAVPFLTISSFYWPLPLLIFIYALVLRRRFGTTSANLAIGAAILCASLVARSLDEGLCASLPLGTHWLWHVLNATMLAWMIETWRRHVTYSATS